MKFLKFRSVRGLARAEWLAVEKERGTLSPGGATSYHPGEVIGQWYGTNKKR